MSVRLFHRGGRFVVVLRRVEDDAGSAHRWLALHRRAPAWPDIFGKARAVLELPPDRADLRWTARRHWTTIDLRLSQGSVRKRQLVAAALLKAARYQA
jgi:hypothetical protein